MKIIKLTLSILFLTNSVYAQNDIKPFAYNGAYLSQTNTEKSHPTANDKENQENVLIEIFLNFKEDLAYGYIEVKYLGVQHKDGVSPIIRYLLSATPYQVTKDELDQIDGVIFGVEMKREGFTSYQKHVVIVGIDENDSFTELLVVDYFDESLTMASTLRFNDLIQL